MADYQWKDGVRIPVDAQVAGERLEWLRDTNGGELTPEGVVSDARSNNSPLHAAFEWDDSKAAEAHRLSQARHLIRHLVVTVEVRKEEHRQPTRAFVHVKRQERPQYVPIATAMSDADMRAQVVDRAWAELLAWRERHAEMKELARIFAAIDSEAAEQRRVT